VTTDNAIWTSSPTGSARDHHRWRLVGGVAAIVAFAIAVVAGAVITLDRSLTRVDVDGLQGGAGPSGSDADLGSAAGTDGAADGDDGPSLEAELDVEAEPITVLVLGSDSREVLTAQERQDLGTGMAWGERTEVVALVRIDAAAGELRMVNIPRDSVVARCDGTSGRINAAYGIGESSGTGGMSCVVQTVSAWAGVGIDHAVKVDFRGFLEIVDAIGGIEMYLEEPMRDRRANLDLQAGCQVLDGADALAFVRARGLDDDFGRISRQQRLLVEMREQARENGVFANPVRTLRFAEAVASSLQVDASLTLNRIRRLVMDHRVTLQQPLEARTVPGTPDTSGEAWLLRPDEEAAAELFRWLLEGDPEPTEPPIEARDREGSDSAPSGDDEASRSTVDDEQAEDEERPIGSRPQRCD
jgi:LCP family protein required for cell wall assembly